MIKIPFLHMGAKIVKYTDIEPDQLPDRLKALIKTDASKEKYLDWDFTYMMSDDPIVFRDGRLIADLIDEMDFEWVKPSD